ncbi:putative ADP-ribosylation factor-like protein 5C isoform X3 [Tupaia chinensis]|uniref:putative ADP-ribosylation factor-like protein 5C isoform X3 n=1 Tax=Tupaia chinensis TaxID=246437 RepID=UPI000FFB9AB2|nr:putative ADP-ribosylation factor-like protein 5C isoform X3 [Tupaia chinensis]
MGQLMAKLMSIFGTQEHKVIIVGLDNAGKTTILYQFLTKEVVHTCPTIGSNVEEIVLRKTHFLVWDIGGQEALRSSWTTYYSNTEASCRAPVDARSGHSPLTSQPTASGLSGVLHGQRGWEAHVISIICLWFSGGGKAAMDGETATVCPAPREGELARRP